MDEQLTPLTQIPSVQADTVPAIPDVPATDEVVAAPEVPEAPPAEKKMRRGGRWTLILGAVIIVAGLVYLLYELGWFAGERNVNHWWGFLILIPAVVSFVVAGLVWRKRTHKLTWSVVRWAIIGLALVALALVFIFKKDLNEVWPVLTIIVGVGVALSWKG